jgi:EAL domain-containing protein (putative c-di-GMP-specific phosphodiesterase class I)
LKTNDKIHIDPFGTKHVSFSLHNCRVIPCTFVKYDYDFINDIFFLMFL